MNMFRLLVLTLSLLVLVPKAQVSATENGEGEDDKEWKVSVGGGLIIAPAFTGSRNYTLLAVPDLRVAYKNLFFANIRDGIGYAVFNQDRWRIGPVVTYTFPRSEKEGGSVFNVVGSSNALQGLGDVAGTVSVGGFVEYSPKPYKLQLYLHKGMTGHEGLVVEGKVSYGGTLKLAGPPLIYSFGPHVRYGDRAYTNAYWGITPEQSARSGLEQYHADAGITAYGISCFAMMPLTESFSVSLTAGFDRLAATVTNSPLVRFRGTENQAMGGMFIKYGF